MKTQKFMLVGGVYAFIGLLCGVGMMSCDAPEKKPVMMVVKDHLLGKFGEILAIDYTPGSGSPHETTFTHEGSWMGFTTPERSAFVNGFCGPINIDTKDWAAQSWVQAGVQGEDTPFLYESTKYYPGHLELISSNRKVRMVQELRFLDKNHAWLTARSDQPIEWYFKGELMDDRAKATPYEGREVKVVDRQVIWTFPSKEVLVLTFPKGTDLEAGATSYEANMSKKSEGVDVLVSFYHTQDEFKADQDRAQGLLADTQSLLSAHNKKWNGYIEKVLTSGHSEIYDRVAVKAMVTLLSNWKAAKGDLLQDGMLPSHSFAPFRGFWAWDTWQQAVATAKFHPELAQSQILAMFDYQDEEGMIADCIFTNKSKNNLRDTKPPLAAWAVYETYSVSQDKEFLKTMFPMLLKYHHWWYTHRDHDKNGWCEFGSTDGSEEAARWESGMDNAIRYDEVKMMKNGEKAWSFDQESVELNAYLIYERKLLQKMAEILGVECPLPKGVGEDIGVFFDTSVGFFFDKKLDGKFVQVMGCEAYTPLWTKTATSEQVEKMLPYLKDKRKFSTFIPFPTVAADHPKASEDGYWRGPIWLNQTYFAISGLRGYGYVKEADDYTDQVFTRLEGLLGDKPIHENYGTATGRRLRASNFSWSAADILFLYWEYGAEK